MIDGQSATTYPFDPQAAQNGWNVTFDEAYEKMQALPQMFLEPDGSWFWTSPVGVPRWQLEGNLYDGGARLAYVDLKGACPQADFARFLNCFGWPETQVLLQLSRAALFITPAEFFRLSQKQ